MLLSILLLLRSRTAIAPLLRRCLTAVAPAHRGYKQFNIELLLLYCHSNVASSVNWKVHTVVASRGIIRVTVTIGDCQARVYKIKTRKKNKGRRIKTLLSLPIHLAHHRSTVELLSLRYFSAIAPLSHQYRYTVAMLSLLCRTAIALLLFRCRSAAVNPLSRCCHTAIAPVSLHCRSAAVAPAVATQLHCYRTVVAPLSNRDRSGPERV